MVYNEPRQPRWGFIYVMECEGFYKIGWSADPEQRLRAMQPCNPFQISLMGTVAAFDTQESIWHERFADRHVRGEWFRISQAETERVLQEPLAEVPRRFKRVFVRGPRTRRTALATEGVQGD